MKVLVIGGGGREHAIIWKLKQSPKVEKIYCAPGNGGIEDIAECVDIKADDIEALKRFALSKEIDLTVVGPEVPLINGIVNEFEQKGLKCFGPRKEAALIEGSKIFAKGLMKKNNIPSAEYAEFSNSKSAVEYLKHAEYPSVIKADGLAEGKGVIIAHDFETAKDSVIRIMEDKIFKDAGSKIVIEEYMKGHEVSVLAFTDGRSIIPMVDSMDHKRVFDNDLGPNTGGMGTISPCPYYTNEISERCMKEIFIPTMEAMKSEGRTFKGVLYFGLMITDFGPKVVEYNCRFGDPETQVVLPRLKTDLVDILLSIIDDRLDKINIEWYEDCACCVIAASGGYPGNYEKGKVIKGLESLLPEIIVFHAGTKRRGSDLFTNGGRVLGVTAVGKTTAEAAGKVYGIIDSISYEGMHYRKDIDR